MQQSPDPISRVLSSDHWIDHPSGRLFARQWMPAEAVAGAPLVMLHDSLGCVELWRNLPAQLCAASARRVIAYDRLGFGRSDARADLPSPDFVVEEGRHALPAVLAQLGVDAFALFGHSVGGGMALCAAAQAPRACDRVVTIAAQVFAEERTLAGIRAAKEQFKDPAQVERLARYHGAKARWVLDAWIDTWLSPAFAEWSLVDVLPLLRCPVLAIHGELDEYGSVAHAQLIGRHAGAGAAVEIRAGRGHMPHRETPDEVVALAAAFLRGSN